jgi:hypothetical protein
MKESLDFLDGDIKIISDSCIDLSKRVAIGNYEVVTSAIFG